MRRNNTADSTTASKVEALDSRRLLANAMSGSQLFITGTEVNDHVFITMDPSQPAALLVNHNGAWSSYDRGALTGIFVAGGAGRDHIIAAQTAGGVSVPITMLGGGGNDLLIGGNGDDVLIGGAGKDRIVGMGGNDQILGGSQRDSIAGADGDDSLVGGRGDDAIEGGAGADAIVGAGGDDWIFGGGGDDLLIGGADNDHLYGGFGDDSVGGGRGDDDIDGQQGQDELAGGGGRDAFKSDELEVDRLVDKTDGIDHGYTNVTLDFVPEQYQDLFKATFPNSDPVGVRVNDDHTFVMLYRYNGDSSMYRAWFTYTGDSPWSNLDGVDLVTYEVAPANLPPLTRASFQEQYPSATVKEVVADHNGDSKFALIRIKEGDRDSRWVRVEWLDGDEVEVPGEPAAA